jgi:hypothetical protein
MEKDIKVTPLLIVKTPVGKMPRDKAMAYLSNIREKILETTKHEYYLLMVPTTSEEFIFEGVFYPIDEVKKISDSKEIEKIIKEYLEKENGK